MSNVGQVRATYREKCDELKLKVTPLVASSGKVLFSCRIREKKLGVMNGWKGLT